MMDYSNQASILPLLTTHRFSIVKRAKWSAHHNIKGMTSDEAKRSYIKTILRADTSFKLPSSRKKSQANPAEKQAQQSTSKKSTAKKKEMSVFLVTVGLCGGVSGVGLAWFLWSVLSYSAMLGLLITFAGLVGMLGCVLYQYEEHGLLGVLPYSFRELLFDTTLLEFLVDGTMFRTVRENVAHMIPLLLSNNDEDRLEVSRVSLL